LADYSYAGYHAGEAALPNAPVVADVKADFGAFGDGVTDDTAAFQNALANMPPGVLSIPQGNYVIRDVLHIDRDDIVLHGAGSGPDGTVLTFPRSLQEITGQEHPWDYGLGGLIKIGTGPVGNNGAAVGSLLAHVTAPAQRGDSVLQVSNLANIRRGDYVLLQMTDGADRSMGLHLHNEQALAGDCSWQPLPFRWPVRVVGKRQGRILLEQPLRMDLDLDWTPKIYDFNAVTESGIEDLRIEMPFHTYPGHLDEVGFNPLTFEGALNCWARNITILNADNGPSFSGMSKHCLMRDVRLVGGVHAHHGFSFSSGAADCVLEQFEIDPVFRHGITLDHLANGNVTRGGTGTDIKLDHHRDSPFENLFTNIHLGWGSDAFGSGGSSCAGPHSGARNTYWNLYADSWNSIPTPAWADIQTNVVPAVQNSMTDNQRWLENVVDLQPVDLYVSQLRRRRRVQNASESGPTGAME
jgi:hypothetical protein